MSALFCCSNIVPYRPQALAHEPKFRAFTQWASFPRESAVEGPTGETKKLVDLNSSYVIQLVRQINFGALESKRYFAAIEANDAAEPFLEVTEADLIEANFEKLNAYVVLRDRMKYLRNACSSVFL